MAVTKLQQAVAEYEQAMHALANAYGQHPRTMDSVGELARVERLIADAAQRRDVAKEAIAEAIGGLKSLVEAARA